MSKFVVRAREMITALFALLVVGTLGQPGYEEDYGEWGEEPEPVGEPGGDYGDPAVSVDYGDRYYVSPGGEYYEQVIQIFESMK